MGTLVPNTSADESNNQSAISHCHKQSDNNNLKQSENNSVNCDTCGKLVSYKWNMIRIKFPW